MRVIVMDDDKLFLIAIRDEMKKLFEDEGMEADIEVAHDIRTLNEVLKKGIPDLVFLDIDMPGKSGTDIAHELRNRYEGIDIIFLTNREDMVFQSIHYLPFRFIRKSKVDEELEEAVFSYIKYYRDKKLLYTFDVAEGKRPMQLSYIVYIESEGHYVRIHTKDESVNARTNISSLENELQKFSFVRIQRSYLVNLKYIKNITGKNVILYNNEELPIKRGSMEYIRECLFKYRRDKI